MSDTIHDYLKEYGDISFRDRPMNDVDSLVLCQFVYLKFDGMVPGVRENKKSVSLEQISRHPDYEKLFADTRFAKDNRALFEEMLSGRRFRNMKLNCYINIIEKEWETQFSAVTFLLEDGTIYVAFRGTDETIVGWKEDFNMGFLSPVPSQELSVKYLNVVTQRFHCPFYVGGHSKGGNLAVYSAMNCIPKVQERIRRVYNMDGPGFRPEVLEKCCYEHIADKVIKYMPHSSLIGMLFEWDTRYKVVEARSFGLGQHNPFNWKVHEGSFILKPDVYEHAKNTDKTINQWIMSLNEQQIRLFVDTLYQIITASQADDLIVITAQWKRSVTGMISALKEVDEDTRKALFQIVSNLMELSRVSRRERILHTINRNIGQRKTVRHSQPVKRVHRPV